MKRPIRWAALPSRLGVRHLMPSMQQHRTRSSPNSRCGPSVATIINVTYEAPMMTHVPLEPTWSVSNTSTCLTHFTCQKKILAQSWGKCIVGLRSRCICIGTLCRTNPLSASTVRLTSEAVSWLFFDISFDLYRDSSPRTPSILIFATRTQNTHKRRHRTNDTVRNTVLLQRTHPWNNWSLFVRKVCPAGGSVQGGPGYFPLYSNSRYRKLL